jgi:hypothetical protein
LDLDLRAYFVLSVEERIVEHPPRSFLDLNIPGEGSYSVATTCLGPMKMELIRAETMDVNDMEVHYEIPMKAADS